MNAKQRRRMRRASDRERLVILDAAVLPTRCPGLPITLSMAVAPVSTSWNQVAKAGQWRGHPAGPFEFTADIYKQIIRNHEATENKRVQVDYEHFSETLGGNVPQEGAPALAWVTKLETRGDELWGLFEWVDGEAVEQVRTGKYMFLSPAVVFNATDRATGENIGARLTSVALTNHPFLDGMEPLTASDPAAAISTSATRAGAAAVNASLSPDAVHIPAAVTISKKKEPQMADLDQEQDNKVSAAMKRMKSCMRLTDDDMEMDDESAFARLAEMLSDYAGLKAAAAKKTSDDAEADVQARIDEGVITMAGKSHALKIRLSDPSGFAVLFPKREAPVQLTDKAKTLLTASLGDSMPKQEARAVVEQDHSKLADARAKTLMSEQPKLNYEQAVTMASAEIKRAHEARVAEALKGLGAL